RAWSGARRSFGRSSGGNLARAARPPLSLRGGRDAALPGKSGANLVNGQSKPAKAVGAEPATGCGWPRLPAAMARRTHGQGLCSLADWRRFALARHDAARLVRNELRRNDICREIRIAQMSDTERASILAELTPPYTLIRPPQQLAPVVFCSPH